MNKYNNINIYLIRLMDTCTNINNKYPFASKDYSIWTALLDPALVINWIFMLQ